MGNGNSMAVKRVRRRTPDTSMKRLVLVLGLAASAASADVVITRSGHTTCTVTGADSLYIQVRLPNGDIRGIPKNDILEVLVSNGLRLDSLVAQSPGVTLAFDPTAIVADTTPKPKPGSSCCLGSGCFGPSCIPALEVGGGVVLVVVVGAAGGGQALLALGAPVATAGITTLVGKKVAPGGGFGGTCIGSYVGAVTGLSVGWGLAGAVHHPYDVMGYAVAGALIGSVPGSIIGYQLSRKQGARKVVPPPPPPIVVPEPVQPEAVSRGRSPVVWVALTGLELGTSLLVAGAIAQPSLALVNNELPFGYGALALAPAGAAAGTALIGQWLDHKGSAWWSLPGAYSGAIGGLLVAGLAAQGLPSLKNGRLLAMPFLPMWLGAGLGAVAGYRMGPSLGALNMACRLEPPAVGFVFKPAAGGRGQEIAGVRLNALSLRF
jgi:hypothetical protein